MNEEEIARSLTRINHLMNQLIYAFMQISMSYRQVEEEIFERLKRNSFGKQTEDD
jgi:hypothetical protein